MLGVEQTSAWDWVIVDARDRALAGGCIVFN